MVGVAALRGCPAARQAGWTSGCPAALPVWLSAVRSLAPSLAGSEGGNNMHHHGIAHVYTWRLQVQAKYIHIWIVHIYPQTASCGSYLNVHVNVVQRFVIDIATVMPHDSPSMQSLEKSLIGSLCINI